MSPGLELPVTPRVMGEWRERGACRTVPTSVFFPERGGDVRPAKAICATCPVIEECREWALTLPEMFGVWGGLSERQRKGAYTGCCQRCGRAHFGPRTTKRRPRYCATCREIVAEERHRASNRDAMARRREGRKAAS